MGRREVLRLVSVTALVLLAAAGCGGAAHPEPTAARALPPALAQQWAAQASSIASAAAHGQGCRAQRLASTLRDEIIAQEGRVPARLRSPLVTGANALADRITCTPQPVTVQAKPPKPPKPHDDHGPGHDHHGKDK
jgi:cell division septation protein DedD